MHTTRAVARCVVRCTHARMRTRCVYHFTQRSQWSSMENWTHPKINEYTTEKEKKKKTEKQKTTTNRKSVRASWMRPAVFNLHASVSYTPFSFFIHFSSTHSLSLSFVDAHQIFFYNSNVLVWISRLSRVCMFLNSSQRIAPDSHTQFYVVNIFLNVCRSLVNYDYIFWWEFSPSSSILSFFGYFFFSFTFFFLFFFLDRICLFLRFHIYCKILESMIRCVRHSQMG